MSSKEWLKMKILIYLESYEKLRDYFLEELDWNCVAILDNVIADLNYLKRQITTEEDELEL